MILYTALLTVFFSCTLQTSQEDISTPQQIPSLQHLCLESKTDFSEGKPLGVWYADQVYESIYAGTTNINPFQQEGQPECPSLSGLFVPYLEKKDKKLLNVEDCTHHKNLFSLYELAIIKRSSEAVEFLVDAGIDINSLEDYSLLHCTDTLKMTSDQVKKYIKKGAATTGTDLYGNTPLHCACKGPEIVKLLLENGALQDIEAQNESGATPLFRAVKYPQSVAYLLEAGANPKAQATAKVTPLHEAADYPESIELLVKAGAHIDAEHEYQATALTISKNPTAIKKLVELGANINFQDNDNATALHNAIAYQLNHIYRKNYSLETKPNYVVIIEELIAQGINIDLKNNNGQTARDLFEKYATEYTSKTPETKRDQKKLQKAEELKVIFETAVHKRQTIALGQELTTYYLQKTTKNLRNRHLIK